MSVNLVSNTPPPAPAATAPANPGQVLENLRTTWRNIQLPATINEEDKATVVGSLRIIFDHLTALETHRDNFNTLRAQCEELQQENQALQGNAIRLGTDLDRAHITIDLLQRNALSLPSRHSSDSTSSTKQQNIPDPERFTANRKELKPFLSQVRLKLQGNASHFPSLSLRLAYITSLVKGPAYAHLEDHIADGFSRIPDVDTLLQILSTAFGDPDEVGTAEREIRGLRQRNSDFATYFAEFQRLMTILSWDPRAKRAALREGLSAELKDALVFVDEKDNFEDYVVQLQNMDNGIRTRAQESKVSKSRTSIPVSKVMYPASTKPDEPFFRPGGLVPMALDASRKISPAERQRRMQEGLCAYCAEGGHFVRECPNKAHNRLRLAEDTGTMDMSKNELTEE